MLLYKQLFCLYLLLSIVSIAFTKAEETNGTVDSDESFKMFCDQKGKYTKRSRDNSETGDLCEVSYPVQTVDPKAAEKFCKIALPYNLHKFKFGTPTICIAESLIVCPSTYRQIDGQCFLLVDEHEHHTYDEAEKICKAKNAKIARLSKTKTSSYWSYYWPELSMVWVDVTSDIAIHSVLNEGNKYAVLYSLALFFRKRRKSLVQIDGKTHMALVMCEKEHAKTGAFVINKMKKYGEIYYDYFLVGNKGYYRTSNRYGRTYGEETENNDVCKKIAKPFSYRKEHAYVLGDTSGVQNLLGENLIVARSVVTYRGNPPDNRKSRTCLNYEYDGHKYFVEKAEYRGLEDNHYYDPCDAQWSLAYIKVNGTMIAKHASDAMRAPLFCQTHISLVVIRGCQKDELLFVRDSGETVCHRFYLEEKDARSWYAAESYCVEEYGGHLSGYTSKKENQFLTSHSIFPVGDRWWQGPMVWMGARRSKDCLWTQREGGFYDNSSKCSIEKFFVWENNVAPNDNSSVLPLYWGRSVRLLGSPELVCLLTDISIYRGYDQRFNGPADCDERHQFVCQRSATATYVPA